MAEVMLVGACPAFAGVKQTIFGQGPEKGDERYGNCMQAALASVLNQSLESVPHFLENGAVDGWWERMNRWLIEQHGVAVIGVTAKDWTPPPVLHLMIGKTVRGTDHVVVGFGGQLMWDPHPSDDGLIEAEHYEFFVAAAPGGLRQIVTDGWEAGR